MRLEKVEQLKEEKEVEQLSSWTVEQLNEEREEIQITVIKLSKVGEYFFKSIRLAEDIVQSMNNNSKAEGIHESNVHIIVIDDSDDDELNDGKWKLNELKIRYFYIRDQPKRVR